MFKVSLFATALANSAITPAQKSDSFFYSQSNEHPEVQGSNRYYQALTNYVKGHDAEAERVPLKPSKVDYQLPEWVDGAFVISGPSLFSAGDKHFRFYFDAFGRFSRFDIKAGQVNFTSKMLKSEFYEACQRSKNVI